MKKIILTTLIIGLIFTTGCWDMKEINERIFPYSAGLDLIDKEDFKEGRYEVTFTYPNINALGSQAIQEDIVYLANVKGNNIFEAAANISDRVQKPMYLRDLKVIIISEKLARDKELMKEMIDGLNRDYVVNKVINFVVVKDTAKELLEVKVKAKKQTSIEGLLYNLLRNDQNSTKFVNSTLDSLVKAMNTCDATVVPVARIEGEDIIVDSVAVFKNYQLQGYLDEEDARNIALLTNKVKDFGIDVDYEGADLTIRSAKPKTKKKLIEDKENLKIKYKLKVEGQIEQFTLGKDDELDSREKLMDMEKALENGLEKSIQKTIHKLQKDFRADTIGLADYLYKFKPKIWKMIEADYEDIYPDIEIDLDVNVEIRRRGLTK